MLKKVIIGLVCLVLIGGALGTASCAGPKSGESPAVPETPTPEPGTERIYIDLLPVQVYDRVLSDELTELQNERNWSELVGKWVRWSGEVEEVLPTNIVVVRHFTKVGAPFDAVVSFDPSWSNRLAELSIDQQINYSGRLVKKGLIGFGEMRMAYGFLLDQGELIAASEMPTLPPILGTYIETPEARGKVVVVNHSWIGNKYTFDPTPEVRVEIKNTCGKEITLSAFVPEPIRLDMLITFKDASGNACNLYGENPIPAGYTKGTIGMPLEIGIGMTRTYNIKPNPYPWKGWKNLEIEKIESYEITIVNGRSY